MEQNIKHHVQMSKCHKFTVENDSIITKITKFIVQRTSSTFYVEKLELFVKNVVFFFV